MAKNYISEKSILKSFSLHHTHTASHTMGTTNHVIGMIKAYWATAA